MGAPPRTPNPNLTNSLAGNHVYWHSYFNINDFDENADYAVFDDIAGVPVLP